MSPSKIHFYLPTSISIPVIAQFAHPTAIFPPNEHSHHCPRPTGQRRSSHLQLLKDTPHLKIMPGDS